MTLLVLLLSSIPARAIEIHVFPDFLPEIPSLKLPFQRVYDQEPKIGPPTVLNNNDVTRLELAQRMIHKFKVPIQWTLRDVSPFRDVQVTHPQYAVVETAWKHGIIKSSKNHEINVQAKATELETWLSLKTLLLPTTQIKDEYNLALLKEDESFKTLTPDQQTALAVLYEHHVLNVFSDLPIQLTDPVTEAWLYDVLNQVDDARELLTSDVKRGVSDAELRLAPVLPNGMELSFSPQQSIIGHQLRVGQALYFSLNHPIYPPNEADVIVEASTLTGQILQLNPHSSNSDDVDVVVLISTIRNGHSNAVWRVKAQLGFTINTSNTQAVEVVEHNVSDKTIPNYILPTALFEIQSEATI